MAQSGAWSQHTHADMPPDVRAKLDELRAALHHLGGGLDPPQEQHQGGGNVEREGQFNTVVF